MANTMTELLPGLYSVSMPEEATNFDCENGHLFYDLPSGILERSIKIGFDFEIVGSCTNDDIDFDCEPYVDKIEDPNGLYVNGQYFGDYLYKNYMTADLYSVFDKENSFRSLLTSKRQHFVNPYGEKPKINVKQRGNKIYSIVGEIYAQWYQAEQNLVKKLVIIKK